MIIFLLDWVNHLVIKVTSEQSITQSHNISRSLYFHHTLKSVSNYQYKELIGSQFCCRLKTFPDRRIFLQSRAYTVHQNKLLCKCVETGLQLDVSQTQTQFNHLCRCVCGLSGYIAPCFFFLMSLIIKSAFNTQKLYK